MSIFRSEVALLLCLVLLAALVLGCDSAPALEDSAQDDSAQQDSAQDVLGLYRDLPEEEVLDAARRIVQNDPAAALVTLDGEGRPRVRTVDVRPLDPVSEGGALSFWIATRPDTRKVDQIRGNSKVALYFNDDDAGSYLSVMGHAVLHDDSATKERIRWRSEGRLRLLWPDYPDDYLLVEVRPDWIEVIGEGVEAHPVTWRPQAAVEPFRDER